MDEPLHRQQLARFPQSLIWLVSRRYVAGSTLNDALTTTRSLNAQSISVTLDMLGEDVSTRHEARLAVDANMQALVALYQDSSDGCLSIKLSNLGLRIDKEFCFQNVRRIVHRAAELNHFVRIDMEDASTTDDTLEIYRRIRKAYDNCGAVIQACLKRSVQDVQLLIDEGIANLRICKGIYIEADEIAFKEKAVIRENFNRLIEMMLDANSYVCIATHDRPLIVHALRLLDERPHAPENVEFQMLLGVTEQKRKTLVDRGFCMRVYVPYGKHWHAYAMRRLKENPQIAGCIIKNLFLRG